MTVGSRPRSAAVIIGTASYDAAGLAELPAVRANVRALHAMLTGEDGAVLGEEEVVVVEDPADPRALLSRIRECAEVAEDVFLVYYAGHGLRTFDDELDDLYLATSKVDEEYVDHTALAFRLLRKEFRASRARKRVLILDCCFSGLAVQTRMSPAPPGLEVQGTYTMVSAHADRASMAPLGATYTAFTGALLSVLREGISDAIDPLPLGAVFPEVESRLRAAGLPLPRQFNTDTGDAIALTRNPAVSSRLTPPQETGKEVSGAPEEEFEQRGSVQTLWRAWEVVCLGFAVGAPAYVHLADIAHPSPLLSFQVTGTYGFLLMLLGLRYRIRVRVDKDGIEIGSRGRVVARYAWTAVAHVQIRARRFNGIRHDLWLTLEPGAQGARHNPFRRYNRRSKSRREVRLTPLFGFGRPAINQLETALRTCAGSRWLPRVGRPIIDQRRAFHARPATFAAALALAGMLTPPVGMIACLVTTGSWTLMASGLIAALPAAVPALRLSDSLVPADLHIDTTGIRVRNGRKGNTRFWAWTSVQTIGCERSGTWKNRPGHLLIRIPETPDGRPPGRVLRLRRLWATPEDITEALRRFAGRRWSTEIHRNDGVVQDDAEALLLQGRIHGTLTTAANLGSAMVIAADFRWLDASGISSHAVASVFAGLTGLQVIGVLYYVFLNGPHFDRFTLRVDADGLTRIGPWSRRRLINWSHVRSVRVDDNRVVLWPSGKGAGNRSFRGLAEHDGGFVLCRFVSPRECVDVQPMRLKRAIARFADNRATLVH
ncbi:caspase family protein [Streptomyces sp. NPDC003996]